VAAVYFTEAYPDPLAERMMAESGVTFTRIAYDRP